MNAANPLETPQPAGNDARSFEPSMEEILASIRRIISDDQMVPKRNTPRDIPALRADTRDGSGDNAPSAPVHKLHVEPTPTLAATVAPPSAPTNSAPASGEAEHLAGDEHSRSRQSATMSAHGTVAAPQFPDLGGASHKADVPLASSAELPSAASIAPEPAARSAPPITIIHAAEADSGGGAFDLPRAEAVAPAQGPADLLSARTNQSVASAFNVLAATRLADHSEELLDLARDMMRPLLRTWIDDNLPSMVERLVRAEIERVARGRR